MTSIKPGPTKPPGYTCKKRVMMVEEVIYEESVKCEDIVEEECFPSYRTIYQPMKVEECETIFKKVCYIAFKNVAREKSVQICQEKKSRDCNLKGQETCTLEEETVCETFKDPTMRTSCQMKMERVCDYDYQGRPINCVQIPKRKCRGRQAKALDIGPPQTECYNFPRKICGPEVCPLVTVIQEIPDEECKMEPQKECRVVTKIVPKLDTQEDCVEVHKEICNNVRNPVKVRKPSIRTWCGIIPQETSMPKKELRTKLFVALGCDELENHITDVEIIALSNQNPPDFKMNLSSRIINDPSDFPHPSNSNPIGGFIGGKPWVCAGFHREGFCTFFNPEANKWEISLKLETLRSSPGSFVDEANDQLWITGGFSVKSNALLNSTEILVKGENIAQGPDLPLPLMAHCAVNVNSTHYMLIGGFGKSYSSTDQVHLVQKETGHSQEMDSLILGRVFHTCGKIESTRGPEIVVIGGISYDGLANHLPIEVFSLTTKNWRTEGVTSQNLTQVVSVEFNSTLLIVGGFSPDNIFELNKETFELMPRKEVLAQKKNSVVAMLIPDNFAYEIKAAKIEAGFLFADATGFDEMKYFNPDSNDICPTRIPSRWDPYDLHASGFLMNGSPWICSKRLHNFPTVNCLKYDMEEQDWLPPTFIDFLFRTVRNPCQLTPNKVWITGGNPYVEYDEWDGTSVVIENGVFDNGPEFPEKDYGFGLHSTVLLERNQTFVTGFNGKHYTYIYNWTDDSWHQVSRTKNDYIIDCELLRDRNFVYCLSIFNLELPRKSPLLQRQTDHNFVKSIWTFDLASSMWSLVTRVETSYFEGRFIRLEGGLYFIALNETQLAISKVNEDTLVLGPAKTLPNGFSPYMAIPFDIPGFTNCSTITDTIHPSPIPGCGIIQSQFCKVLLMASGDEIGTFCPCYLRVSGPGEGSKPA
ncbi:hypothetical protein TCAL_01782 [Tigriopus californicus]|uniref:Uncharacterized protein n=1 Tax=Tigriopus californicus TaxID=6832 RepID=A0A553N952_TIGCA|nr:hypothetical protein TCAL_01782 [Tigriopus californicus]